MALLQDRGALGEDPGEWFFWQKDPDTDEDVSLRVRRIPEIQEREIALTVGADVVDLASDKSPAARKRVADAQRNWEIARAAWAWLESRNLSVAAVGAAGAANLSAVLGEDVQAEAEVLVDGRLTDALKRHLLGEHAALRAFVLGRAASLWERAKSREAARSKN